MLTTAGGAVFVLCTSRLLFLLSSSLTGSRTRTPWYGLGLARAGGGATEPRHGERGGRLIDLAILAISVYDWDYTGRTSGMVRLGQPA